MSYVVTCTRALDSLSKEVGFVNADEFTNKFLEKSKSEGTLDDVFREITEKIEEL